MQPNGSRKYGGTAALFRAPAPPANFTGRSAEIRQVQAALSEHPATVVGIFGQGGVGKTALALVLARQLASDYPDAQIFIDLQGATQPLDSLEVMRQVIHAYRPMARLPDDADGILSIYRSALDGQQALLLFDSAASSVQLSSLVPPAGCLMLVTGREPLSLPGMRSLRLDRLSMEEAQALLLALAPRIGPQAAEVAELCGQLPLALNLAGSVLASQQDLSPADYADRLMAAQWRQSTLDEAEASLALSYDLLGSEMQRLWRHLAVFPAEFDQPAAAAVWAVSDDQAERALGELARCGLVAYQPEVKRYCLHDLARQAASGLLLASEGEPARRRHAAYYAGLLAAAGKSRVKDGDDFTHSVRLYDLERGNILAGQAWAARRPNDDEAAARLASDYGVSGAQVLALRQTLREQQAWLEAAAKAAHRLGDQKTAGELLSKLGSVFRRLRQPHQALEYYGQCLRIAREIGNRRAEGTALGNLGLAFADLGNTRRAAEYYEQSLLIAREMGNRRDEARTSWNLGLAYEELGDLAAAIGAMQVCVAYEREIGHPNAVPDAAEVERLRARLAGRARR